MIKKALAVVCAISLIITGIYLYGNKSLAGSGAGGAILLTPENTVIFAGEVSGESCQATALELQRLVELRGDKDYTIYLVMNTPGGSIYDGINFIEFAKTFNNVKTITIFAASMGAMIVESLPYERLILENGILMFHRAKGQFSGQFEDGELESELIFWKNMVRGAEQKVADRMGLPLDEYKQKIVNELWLRGNEAASSRAVDSVVSVKCSNELIEERYTVKESALGIINFDVTYSKCPLLTAPISVEESQ